MYKLDLLDEVENDLMQLSDEILSEVIDYFEKYEIDPLKYSQKLFNKGGLNLEGYRKTYLANATYRIVIKVENNIAKIVEVVAVGKREKNEVYEEAFKRVLKNI
ncbi:type II toxin-antitoxin system RelE family toxin [Arcobacter vandammei]|uniref:type II toxin-antitoxin system RelE family toxin n=1 Tax=Arcobacter vandammei TaxID=2782243 RepID=UPI0018DF7376|nr:hypothetical protein [Arcobacter vandammei]